MSEHIRWAKGGTANVVRLDKDAVTLSSSIPSPPGSRIDGTIAPDFATTMRVKIHGSKLQADGTFVLEGRAIDWTRDVRARLAAMASGPTE